MRVAAIYSLWGIADCYMNAGFPHNLRVHVPSDGRNVRALPWDMDFVMNFGASSPPVLAGGNLLRVLNNAPGARHAYYGHLHELCATTFTGADFTPWLAHYGGVVGQSKIGASGYIETRRASILSQLPASVTFSITTNGGADFSVNTASTTLAAGEFIVAARNVSAFQARYGAGPRIAGAYRPADSLSNGDETITLVDATGAPIQSFTYNDAWFPLTDGPGRALVVRDESAPIGAWDGAGQWAASITIGSTPGVANTGQLGTQFEGWRHTFFTAADIANPAISGALVSTDGVTNAPRYALGYFTPHQPTAALSVIGGDGTFLTITYRRTKNALDATFTIEGTPDLVTWTALVNPTTTTIDHGDGTEAITVRDTVPISAGPKRDLRVRVTLQP